MSERDGSPWWTEAFRRPYLECYAHRDDASAEREAAFLAPHLGVTPGLRLLDAGCGAGRHARAFASRGALVVGVDRSADLLREAVQRGGRPRYVMADVRSLPLRDGVFDAVVSLFTSFGYFDAAGDRAHMAQLRRVMRRGGRFALDFLNAPRVTRLLVRHSKRAVGEMTVQETRTVRGKRIEKEVIVTGPGAAPVAKWYESVRLYRRDELHELLDRAGFRARAEFGDLAGGAWSHESERLVLVAEAV